MISFPGHALDMISRIKNNKRERKTMYDDKQFIYSDNKNKIKTKRLKKLSKKLKEEIDTKMAKKRKSEYLKIIISFTFALILVFSFLIYLFR